MDSIARTCINSKMFTGYILPYVKKYEFKCLIFMFDCLTLWAIYSILLFYELMMLASGL